MIQRISTDMKHLKVLLKLLQDFMEYLQVQQEDTGCY